MKLKEVESTLTFNGKTERHRSKEKEIERNNNQREKILERGEDFEEEAKEKKNQRNII